MPNAAPVDLSLWQEHMDYRLPRRPMLRPDEIATALGVDERTIERLFTAEFKTGPELHGIEFNAAKGQRMHRRILRDSAILFYAEHSNYTPQEFRTRILEVLTRCTVRDLVVFQQALAELIRRKQG